MILGVIDSCSRWAHTPAFDLGPSPSSASGRKGEVMKHNLQIVPLLFMALAPAAMASSRWYVDGMNGSNHNDCKSPQHACKTIRHAITLASSGDSIMVAAATYTEHLTINFSLKIVGSSATTTIIDGGRRTTVIEIHNSGPDVALSNVTIRNARRGVFNYATLTLDDCIISGNFPNSGIVNVGTMTLNRCTISRNGSTGIDGYYSNGGGIDNNAILIVNNSTISENSTTGTYVCGGGIYNTGTLTINNSTLNGNRARGPGNSNGGGIDNEGGAVVLNNSTLTGNKALPDGSGYGGGISNGGCVTRRSNPSTMTLQNTMVANNAHGGNCSGPMTSMGYNLSSDKTCSLNGTGDLNNTVPKLGKLGNYGGPTQTIPLLSGSPAIDAGNPTGCTNGQGHLLKTDQRGRPRPDREDKSGCDMGAYERQSD
jgi:hypothetical protein